MVKAVVDFLRARDIVATLAYYEPYSVSPECSVPLSRLFTGRSSTVKYSDYYGCDCVGIGCYLPELEFTHYLPNRHWQALIKQHDYHMVVSGSCLAALPFVKTSTKFLAWIASDWQGDRAHRVSTFPWYRRLIDSTLITFMCQRLERQVIASNSLIALSEHTQRMLNQRLDSRVVKDIFPMPIDTERLVPQPVQKIASDHQRSNYRIGFIGRFEDPRKNIALLIRAAAKLIRSLPELMLVLVGDQLSEPHARLATELGVADNLRIFPYLEGDELLEKSRSLDLFVLPSHQEGLCIAALEAMSCGVPVVSTCCGGPESYIESGENGLLVASDVDSMAAAILQLLSDEQRRLSYAENARETVLRDFSKQAQENVFWTLFDDQFQSL